MVAPWVTGLHANAGDPAVVGHKAASLASLIALGLAVPEGFTVGTGASVAPRPDGLPDGLEAEVRRNLERLEVSVGRTLASGVPPFLLAVRTGGPLVLPGVAATVLGVGLSRPVVERVAAVDPLFAWGSWARFLAAFADGVLDVHYTRLARAREQVLAGRALGALDAEGWRALSEGYERAIAEAGKVVPTDPAEQVLAAIGAAYRAYGSHGARYLRKKHGISEESGVAVTVQRLVHAAWSVGGVAGGGTLATRDPESGRRGVVGRFVAGGSLIDEGAVDVGLDAVDDGLRGRLESCAERVESALRDAAEVAFTVEAGELWVLEARPLGRSPLASVQIAVDLAQAGTLTIPEALFRVEPSQLETLLRPVVKPGGHRRVVCKGLEASPGAATGRVVFDPADAVSWKDRDIPTVLVRVTTSQEGVQGMAAAVAILTTRGGHTSHAAVAARQMGKPCVVGCNDIQIDYSRELFYAGDTVVRKGDWLTVDGTSGEVLEGQVETSSPRLDTGALGTLLGWADEVARIKVRVNADNATDARRGREWGATGIGLCRTEHMFFQPEALRAVRRMILANDARARQRALADLLPIQRRAFREIFLAIGGLPVTIRLLDPPLHDFLPVRDEDVSAVSEDLGVRVELLMVRMQQLAEANPLMGHRGVRIGLTEPEVYRIQVRALFEAACKLMLEGVEVRPEVMVPLVSLGAEIERMRRVIETVAEEVIAEYGVRPDYRIGTMVELPRACLVADELAPHASFFSFGTNDLTQATYGMSRDDMGRFFPHYQREGILPESPLVVFDERGVGALVAGAIQRGLEVNPRLQIGVCGEHGGDPRGVAWFHRHGVDYVSTSPFRVPVARLAAAQAALVDERPA